MYSKKNLYSFSRGPPSGCHAPKAVQVLLYTARAWPLAVLGPPKAPLKLCIRGCGGVSYSFAPRPAANGTGRLRPSVAEAILCPSNAVKRIEAGIVPWSSGSASCLAPVDGPRRSSACLQARRPPHRCRPAHPHASVRRRWPRRQQRRRNGALSGPSVGPTPARVHTLLHLALRSVNAIAFQFYQQADLCAGSRC